MSRRATAAGISIPENSLGISRFLGEGLRARIGVGEVKLLDILDYCVGQSEQATFNIGF
jgi:hypothetical protein